jgi:hypothetical protein
MRRQSIGIRGEIWFLNRNAPIYWRLRGWSVFNFEPARFSENSDVSPDSKFFKVRSGGVYGVQILPAPG